MSTDKLREARGLPDALDAIFERQAERHADISRAAAQIEEWKRQEKDRQHD